MNRNLITLALCSVVALGLVACGDDGGRTDAGPDTGVIVLPDGGDTGTGDTSTDTTRPDTGTMMTGCDVGDPCNPTRGCRLSTLCIDEFAGEIGGAEDPVQGLPGGGDGIPTTSWTDGYCSNAAPVDMGGCDPADEDSCGGIDCALCLNAGTDTRGVTVGLCAATCTPSLTDNGACRDDYDCGLTSGACVPGCAADDECRVVRKDTNGNGFIDPYDAMTNPMGDELVYDDSTMAACNLDTYRCGHTGAAGAVAGDTCEFDFECEANGDCIADFDDPATAENEGGWPGGYCTKFGCDIAGNDCEGAGKCQERGLGIAICVLACEVASTTGDIYAPNTDCAAGYACFWDGTSGAGAGNGGCVPGNYNDVRAGDATGQVGQACMTEEDCYSPFGAGQCRDFGAGDHCTLFDCGAPGMPADVCGAGATCAQISGSDTSLCVKDCTAPADCLPGNGCWDTSVAGINTGGATVCFPGCLEDSHCLASERCVGASMTATGECM